MRGQVAIAEHRWPEAIAELRAWEQEGSPLDLIWLADALDQAGQADSALATYKQWLTIPEHTGSGWWLPRTLRRLGELHEGRGEQIEASSYYRRFADLWADADSELQPMVREARSKAVRLGPAAAEPKSP
jgi:tetratricopeptide (TPR) repeat protein